MVQFKKAHKNSHKQSYAHNLFLLLCDRNRPVHTRNFPSSCTSSADMMTAGRRPAWCMALLVLYGTVLMVLRPALSLPLGEHTLRKYIRRSNTRTQDAVARGGDSGGLKLPQPTHFGYLDVNKAKGSSMYYAYYEAQEPEADASTTPIVLWLQGGPGCSSFFGMLYINGPYFVNDDLTLRPNLGTWGRLYGLLFIEQPIGVGWSPKGTATIPDNELDVAWDLYRALQTFYRTYPAYEKRPLIITGESYAGKYVPSIAHFILQADAKANGYLSRIKHPRPLHDDVEAPVFQLGGMAIGNGFTDAETQTAVQSEVAWSMGLISLTQRRQGEKIQAEIIELVRSKRWRQARAMSDRLLGFIVNASGSATLEDVRRNTGYDGSNMADAYLNQKHVREAMNAPPGIVWESCSKEVDQVMGHDVMKSVKNLVADMLSFRPVLLYQGQFDAECGVASNDAWITTMPWSGHIGFTDASRDFWMVNQRIAGYWKKHKTLSHVIIRNTGHMVPHDNPLYGQLLLERWIEEEVRGRVYDRQTTMQMEKDYANPDQGDQST